MIAIVDYHAGNIGSIRNMIKKIGRESVITNDPHTIESASHIIIPGVGSFDYGMEKLESLGLIPVLNAKREAGTPILGICLGAQVMCVSSEEGKRKGLQWIDAEVVRFPHIVDGKKFTVPHMGWDFVSKTKDSKLFSAFDELPRFYFVHSYCIQCKNACDILTSNQYSRSFHSSFERDNVIGVQFHPEKSHRFGKKLLTNFLANY